MKRRRGRGSGGYSGIIRFVGNQTTGVFVIFPKQLQSRFSPLLCIVADAHTHRLAARRAQPITCRES